MPRLNTTTVSRPDLFHSMCRTMNKDEVEKGVKPNSEAVISERGRVGDTWRECGHWSLDSGREHKCRLSGFGHRFICVPNHTRSGPRTARSQTLEIRLETEAGNLLLKLYCACQLPWCCNLSTSYHSSSTSVRILRNSDQLTVLAATATTPASLAFRLRPRHPPVTSDHTPPKSITPERLDFRPPGQKVKDVSKSKRRGGFSPPTFWSFCTSRWPSVCLAELCERTIGRGGIGPGKADTMCSTSMKA